VSRRQLTYSNSCQRVVGSHSSSWRLERDLQLHDLPATQQGAERHNRRCPYLRGPIGEDSQLAVVASTLGIASLFEPLRRRVHTVIDRLFYLRKYDARKTLEAFSTKLCDETDLEALRGDLVEVVKETMQPANVSLWLRPETASKREQGD
jgi:hypothetical protein